MFISQCDLLIIFSIYSLGHLLLTKVNFVDVKSVQMLNAVGALCPSLKEVVFCSTIFIDEVGFMKNHKLSSKIKITPEELGSILKKWPKVMFSF